MWRHARCSITTIDLSSLGRRPRAGHAVGPGAQTPAAGQPGGHHRGSRQPDAAPAKSPARAGQRIGRRLYGASPNASMEPLDEIAPPRPGEFQSDLCAAIEHEARRAEALGVRVVRMRCGAGARWRRLPDASAERPPGTGCSAGAWSPTCAVGSSGRCGGAGAVCDGAPNPARPRQCHGARCGDAGHVCAGAGCIVWAARLAAYAGAAIAEHARGNVYPTAGRTERSAMCRVGAWLPICASATERRADRPCRDSKAGVSFANTKY